MMSVAVASSSASSLVVEHVGEGLGFGLRATRDLPLGTVVLRERPIAVLRASELRHVIGQDPPLERLVASAADEASAFSDAQYWPAPTHASAEVIERFASHVFAQLPEPLQRKWMSLADSFSVPPAKSPGNVVRSNAFTDTAVGDSYLYEVLSRANHSCRPNISRTFEGSTVVVRTTRTVAAGEPLLISYLSDTVLARPTNERRAALRAKFCFHCECERCGERCGKVAARAGRLEATTPPQPSGKSHAGNLAGSLAGSHVAHLDRVSRAGSPAGSLAGSRTSLAHSHTGSLADSTPMLHALRGAHAALQAQLHACHTQQQQQQQRCQQRQQQQQPAPSYVSDSPSAVMSDSLSASTAACVEALRAVEGALCLLAGGAAEDAVSRAHTTAAAAVAATTTATTLAAATTAATDTATATAAAAAAAATTTMSSEALAFLASRLDLATRPTAALLDLRSEVAFDEMHLQGAASFSLSTLPHRTAELPPASSAGLHLLGASVAELAHARHFLNEQVCCLPLIATECHATESH